MLALVFYLISFFWVKLTAERRVGDGGLTNDFSVEALLTISLQGPPTLSPSCSVLAGL